MRTKAERGDSNPNVPLSLRKLQNPDCQRCQICHRCRRPLHAIARWKAVFRSCVSAIEVAQLGLPKSAGVLWIGWTSPVRSRSPALRFKTLVPSEFLQFPIISNPSAAVGFRRGRSKHRPDPKLVTFRGARGYELRWAPGPAGGVPSPWTTHSGGPAPPRFADSRRPPFPTNPVR
jgi:hypothetical protein